jgi:peroxiredoxin
MVWQSDSLASSPQDVCPLLPGTPVPDVTVQAIDGSQVNLADLVRESPAIIVFYRGGW